MSCSETDLLQQLLQLEPSKLDQLFIIVKSYVRQDQALEIRKSTPVSAEFTKPNPLKSDPGTLTFVIKKINNLLGRGSDMVALINAFKKIASNSDPEPIHLGNSLLKYTVEEFIVNWESILENFRANFKGDLATNLIAQIENLISRGRVLSKNLKALKSEFEASAFSWESITDQPFEEFMNNWYFSITYNGRTVWRTEPLWVNYPLLQLPKDSDHIDKYLDFRRNSKVNTYYLVDLRGVGSKLVTHLASQNVEANIIICYDQRNSESKILPNHFLYEESVDDYPNTPTLQIAERVQFILRIIKITHNEKISKKIIIVSSDQTLRRLSFRYPEHVIFKNFSL